jgi:CheY-like chemotaxis protein
VEIAGDGQEAIYLTERNRYDVILMDVQMPGMDGLEATAAIRKREDASGKGDSPHLCEAPSGPFRQMGTVPFSARVPIIAMTAHARSGDRERCLAAGMDGYLSKPINSREMIALLESLAANIGTASTASGPTQPLDPTAAVVFDLASAMKQCLNKRDLLGQVIDLFFKDADRLLPQMRAALQKGDLTEVGRLGHRLKGTLVHLGAEPARAAARRVERLMLHGGEQAEAEKAVGAFERECDLLKQALSSHRSAVARAEGNDGDTGK